MKKKLALLLAVVLCLGLMTACGGEKGGNGEDEEDLKEFKAEGIGTFYLPDDYEMTTGTWEEPFTSDYVLFQKGDISIYVNYFDQEVYDATGTTLPADLEEYSQRPGAVKDLPEGGSYEEDEYGNLSVSYTDEDGIVHYLILMAGTDSYATAGITYPEGTEDTELIPKWLHQTKLD